MERAAAATLAEAATGGVLVGVDVGGSKTAVRVATPHGQVLSHLVVPTDVSAVQRTLAGIGQAVVAALAEAGVPRGAVAAIGLGIPGRVDPRTGVVGLAVNLNWQAVSAGALLAEALGAPCYVENDVRAAAVAVHQHFGAEPAANLAYVSVGTGIAAGLVLRGQLYTGAHGMAGEIGHMLVAPEGPRCACGGRGCLEAVAAGPAIVRLAEQAVKSGALTQLARLSPLTTAGVYRAAAAGDPAAQRIADEAGRHLARALYSLVLAYDVDRVVLGGGVARAGEPFFRPIVRELDRLRQQSPLAREMLRPEMFSLLPPDFEAGTWGALAVAQQGLRAAQRDDEPGAGGEGAR